MSFDDYANHIYQKHQLAVALGIIKSKPPNITTAEYLKQLKSIVEHKMDDDDVTVCSDDFLMDDDDDMNDSVTILKDFDLGMGRDGCKEFDEAENEERLVNKKNTTPKDSTQTTYYDSSQSQFTPNIDNTIYGENHNLNQNLVTEQCLVKNIVDRNEEFNALSDSNDNIINKTKSHTINIETNAEINHSNNKSVDYASNTQNTDVTYYDSQKTILYTVHGFTQNYTHYSPSQNDIMIPSEYIRGVKSNKAESKDRNEENNIDNITELVPSKSINEMTNKIHTENSLGSKIYDNPSNYREYEYIQTMNMFSQNNDECFNQTLDDLGNQNTYINNAIDMTIKDLNTNTNDEHKTLKHNTTICNFTQNAQNIDEYFQEMQKLDTREFKKCVNSNLEYTDIDIRDATVYNQNADGINSKNVELNKLSENETNNLKNTQNHQLLTSDVVDFHKNHTEIEEEITEESQEIISYKVLGEFNKVKTYLSRSSRKVSCDGYSTDSGYRSDSQIRSSNRSALQLSGNWLNQSGCCLYNYIIQCPLVASTRDITNEIAQVLSQLIDRLHEEENYPSFLEDILESVDMLLRQVYEGVSSGDSEFLKKDECVQRILLLNKSIHIQQHSIEKISNILESFHSKITEKETTYELSNIDQVENISYIFHILEILLKKYLKSRDLLSQSSTQLSQDEDKVFKKSSLTDIWRKKWNPSQKVFEGSREKKCVLKLCSDVLNKIVVDCVNSYSLVAYSALKCFNSMQS